jgi:hypothetical protein
MLVFAIGIEHALDMTGLAPLMAPIHANLVGPAERGDEHQGFHRRLATLAVCSDSGSKALFSRCGNSYTYQKFFLIEPIA